MLNNTIYKPYFVIPVEKNPVEKNGKNCLELFIQGIIKKGCLLDTTAGYYAKTVVSGHVTEVMNAAIERCITNGASSFEIARIFVNLELETLHKGYWEEESLIRVSFVDRDGNFHEKNSETFEQVVDCQRVVESVSFTQNLVIENSGDPRTSGRIGDYAPWVNFEPIVRSLKSIGLEIAPQDFIDQILTGEQIELGITCGVLVQARFDSYVVVKHLNEERFEEGEVLDPERGIIARQGLKVRLAVTSNTLDWDEPRAPTINMQLKPTDEYNPIRETGIRSVVRIAKVLETLFSIA